MKILIMIFLFLMISSAGFGDTTHHKAMKMTDATKTKEAKAVKQVKCPVYGTMIDPDKAYSKTTYKGKTYYFCCADCAQKFKKNPKMYVKYFF